MDNCDNIYNKLCNDLIIEIENFENSYEELDKMIIPTIPKYIKKYQSIQQFYVQAADLKMIIKRKIKKCIVFGRTSSGKSSLINAMLTEEILPTSCGSTSNSFVQIKASPSKREYIIANNKEKKLNSLAELTSLLCEGHIKDLSHIDLFYSKNKCNLLKDNIEIIDTPGIDSDTEFDKAVLKYCKDADLIILVVNSLCGISLTEKEFLKKFRVQFSKLRVLIVFNFWDIPDGKRNRLAVRQQYMENAYALLNEELGYSKNDSNNSIFFLSALERINIFYSDVQTEKSDSLWNARNKSFAQFLNTVENQLLKLEHHRKADCLNGLHSLVSHIFKNSKAYDMIMNRKKEILQYFHKSISQIDTVITVKCVTKVFEEIYQEFIREANMKYEDCLNTTITRNNKKIDEKELIRNGNKELKLLLQNIAEKHGKQLEMFINKSVGELPMKSLSWWILKEFYFPKHFNFSQIIKYSYEDNSDIFYNEIKEINQKIKSGKQLANRLSTCATVATFGFGVATGGLSGLVLAAGRITIAGLVGYGCSSTILNNMKNPFEFYWEKDAKSIRELMENLKMKFFYEYVDFKESFAQNFDSIYCQNSESIQNKLDDLKIKIQKYEIEL